MKYSEERHFSKWFLVVYFIISSFILGIALWITHIRQGQLYYYRILVIIEWLIALFLIYNFWKFKITVVSDELVFGFGFIRKRFKLKDVVKIEPVNLSSRWYFNYGIYGKRKEKQKIYAAFNGPAVNLTVRNLKSNYIISTQNQNQLIEIIKTTKY